MKIWLFSDLHLEFGGIKLPDPLPVADVCVVAGDVLTKGILPSLEWLASNIGLHMPVVFVAGNHEFYGGFLLDSLDVARKFDGGGKVHFLEDSAIEIGGTVFCGATLWTDFEILGTDSAQLAMREAKATMNDYKKIRHRKQPFESLQPTHTRRAHVRSRSFLEKSIAQYAGKELVFVTHHAPSLASVEEHYRNDLATAAYASDVIPLMEGHGPKFWIHGHIHHRVDYVLGGTRVLSNPRGYPGEPAFEGFDSGFVIEV